jgi:hypothetical protein
VTAPTWPPLLQRLRARVAHLVRRTVVSTRGREPSAADEEWASSQLTAGERELWCCMGAVDRAHAVEVARGALARYGPDRRIAAAGLLHDVGKIESGLGVPGRVVATLVGPVVPRRWAPRLGRLGCYLTYPERGSGLLAAAGSDPLVVAWAAEHHRPPSSWTIEPAAARALRDADDAAG